jgi:hypothetical protein
MRVCCDNCAWEGGDDETQPANDITERHALGVVYSDLDCPECAGLCYPVDPRDCYPHFDVAKARALLQGLRDHAEFGPAARAALCEGMRISFTRTGAFFETYGDAAQTVAAALGYTLERDKSEQWVVGIPYHRMEADRQRLIEAGHTVTVGDGA